MAFQVNLHNLLMTENTNLNEILTEEWFVYYSQEWSDKKNVHVTVCEM